MSNAGLDALIWVLVYGGLLLVCLGAFVRRTAEVMGWVFIVFGGVLAVAGGALVVVRARRPDDPPG